MHHALLIALTARTAALILPQKVQTALPILHASSPEIDKPSGMDLSSLMPKSTDALAETPVMFGVGAAPSFDFDRWDQHRSTMRYTQLIAGLFVGITTRRVAPVVAALTIFSCLVAWYDNIALTAQELPELQLPLTPFELTAPVLGLLLVFRTNAGYERFSLGSDAAWEITSSIRDLIRQVSTWTKEEDADQGRAIVDELCTFHDWLMTSFLREAGGASEDPFDIAPGVGCSPAAQSEITERLQRMITRCDACDRYLSPAVVMLDLGVKIRKLGIEDNMAGRIDENLCKIQGSLGCCEKLLRTPIPLGYTRYTVRFLWLWLSLLPFALVRTFSEFGVGTWWEEKLQPVVVLVMAFIGLLFLSIEDIGVQIEEPFAILPLERHAEWLRRDAFQMRKIALVESFVAPEEKVFDPMDLVRKG